MKTMKEAIAYANNRKAKNPSITHYLMTNGERYVVAYGEEDMKYGEELGYRLAVEI